MNRRLELQQKINQLRRERAELSSRIYVIALADEDEEATALYGQLIALDSEIYLAEQMKQDALQACYLANQGAAAVEKAERILERAQRERAAAVAWVEEWLGCK